MKRYFIIKAAWTDQFYCKETDSFELFDLATHYNESPIVPCEIEECYTDWDFIKATNKKPCVIITVYEK